MKGKKILLMVVILSIAVSMITMASIPPPPANCSPGFWKNHPEEWKEYAPDDQYLDTGMTLMEALQGGKATRESRFIVAGWLNESNPYANCGD